MTKNVRIRISGTHRDEEERMLSEPVVISADGTYYFRNGSHFVLYEEMQEGAPERARSLLQFSDRMLKMKKHGQVESVVQIRPGERMPLIYDTPYGRLVFTSLGREFLVQEEKDRIKALIRYKLEQDEDFVAECSLEIELESI